MPNTNTAASGLKCMNCGAPIASGFFCKRCEAGDEPTTEKEAKAGSRFSGETLRKRKQKLLLEDLARWGKMLLILAIVGGVGYGVYAVFGDQIKAKITDAQKATAPKEKYDPTKDANANEEDGAGGTNGKRAFSSSTR